MAAARSRIGKAALSLGVAGSAMIAAVGCTSESEPRPTVSPASSRSVSASGTPTSSAALPVKPTCTSEAMLSAIPIKGLTIASFKCSNAGILAAAKVTGGPPGTPTVWFFDANHGRWQATSGKQVCAAAPMRYGVLLKWCQVDTH
jgi:hypothetical protein